MGGSDWLAVVPVKRLATAKSRLRGALPGVPHEDLALALVLDTVVAALGCAAVASVVVVTDDARVRVTALGLGAAAIPDAPDAGLNAAFGHGAALAAGRPVAALAGDLPALRPGELAAALSAALSAAAGGRSFVADAGGTGTTLLAAPAGVTLAPRFGPDSAAAHARAGALPLTGAWPTLRQDVDTPADLDAARLLGLGAHTAALVRTPILAEGAAAPHYPDGMPGQGTVASFDPRERSGTVLLDDGRPVDFEAAAFDASGLRLLRPGQRVRLEWRGEQIAALTLITM